MQISVILPVYNEEKTINQVISSLLEKVDDLLEVIVVDDGSTDSTGVICKEAQANHSVVRYFFLPKNKGKTAALKEGIKLSIGDIVIVQDADLEYDPFEINAVVDPIQKNDLNLTDVETCYKAFRGNIIRNMVITSRRFGFEIEVVAKIAKLKCRVYEVPISYYGRSYEEGKKIGFVDGLMALIYIFKYNLFTSRKASFHKHFSNKNK